MATIKYIEATSILTILNTATEGTALASLANNARAISNGTGDVANQTNLDLAADLELSAIWAATPTAGSGAEVYLLTSVDGTNFPYGSTSLTPAAIALLGVFEITAVATAQRMVIPGVALSPRITRGLLINVGGTALSSATTHTLKAQAYRLQSV